MTPWMAAAAMWTPEGLPRPAWMGAALAGRLSREKGRKGG